MKKILINAFLLIMTMLTTSCRHHDEPSDIGEDHIVERTVIVYMAAENSLSPYARSDSSEIARGLSAVTDDYNLILYKDDVHLPVIYWMTARKGIREWKQYKMDQDSADSTIMLNTLRSIIKAFPAHHYGLVLWSHANGWVPKLDRTQDTASSGRSTRRTWGIDNNSNSLGNIGSEMEITTLRWILDQLPRMDFILFDTCFMQNIESAYELRGVADYLIGSPAEIPGNGAPYTSILESLMKADAISIAEKYYQTYKNSGGVALSVIDCLELENLATVTAGYLPKIFSSGSKIDTEGVQNYVPYDAGFSWRPEGYDMKSFMHKHLEADDFENWLQALNRAVPFSKATDYWASQFYGSHNHLNDPNNYSGVAMFIPNTKYNTAKNNWNEAFRRTSWYKAAGWANTGW